MYTIVYNTCIHSITWLHIYMVMLMVHHYGGSGSCSWGGSGSGIPL